MRLQYVGEPERVYPAWGIEPVPGEIYDVPDNPQDGRWEDPESVEKVSGADDHPGFETVELTDEAEQE